MKHFPLLALAVGLALSPLTAAAETASVITREGALRQECRFLAPVVVKVRYQDQLEVLARQGEWLRVSINGQTGCIHQSAVIRRAPAVDRLLSEDRHFAEEDEITLAGKGFTPEVEAGYREQKLEVDFSRVDALESAAPSESDLRDFVAAGGLSPPP